MSRSRVWGSWLSVCSTVAGHVFVLPAFASTHVAGYLSEIVVGAHLRLTALANQNSMRSGGSCSSKGTSVSVLCSPDGRRPSFDTKTGKDRASAGVVVEHL
ncbi:hypothetical protein BKA70DRAFT_1567991 [Coprinopsis sp. MPI-PUGE-AT-0042]|nr:hypothetical protein BKA70DRAFT_1567991 [Coprinopsis sp. MPI-PUGE-AT-0042]